MNAKLLCIFAGCIVVAHAGLITDGRVQMIVGFSEITSMGTLSTSLTDVSYRQADLSGTVCWDGFCPGQATPTAGPTYEVNSPLTFRLVDFSLANCAADYCSMTVRVGGYVNAFAVGDTVNAAIRIQGKGSPNFFIDLYSGISSGGSAAFILDDRLFSDASGELNYYRHFGTVHIPAQGGPLLAVGIYLDPVVIYHDQSISSLNIDLILDPRLPEPGTVLSVAAGLAAMGFAREIRKRRPIT